MTQKLSEINNLQVHAGCKTWVTIF